MDKNDPEQISPLERVERQFSFAQSHRRDMVAVTTSDLNYLLSHLHSTHCLGYKDETPQA